MMRKTVFIVVALLAAVGCSRVSSSDAGSGASVAGKRVARTALDPAKVKNGKRIFDQMCVACHQPDGVGKPGIAPRLNSPDFLGLASDEFIRTTILEGRPGTAMMSYKLIPQVAKNVDDLVAYIRSWQYDYANFTDYHVDWNKKIKGDAARGQQLFRHYCASCHGHNGGGYADGGAGPGIGLPGFLKVASDDYIKKTIQIGRAGTAMKPFGHGRGLANIDEKDIDDIVAYLRSLE